MSYTVATIRQLSEMSCDVTVVHWDQKKLTPYYFSDVTNVQFLPRSNFTNEKLIEFANDVDPDITVVSGWMDKGYMNVAKLLRLKGKNVVVSLDGQWQETLRQHVAGFLGKFGFFGRYYSHAWVAGARQYEYARRLGFCANQIVFDFLTADYKIFDQGTLSDSKKRVESYPRRFLYVGRCAPEKGLDVLVKAWKLLGSENVGWELHMVGSGFHEVGYHRVPGIICKEFMQPELLVQEGVNADCFVLPSKFEPWGVVVQEFALLGLPLIVSDAVGSASTFVIPGLNGYTFKVNDEIDLCQKMRYIVASTDEELSALGRSSTILAQRINPVTSAQNLLSVASL